MMKKKIPLLCLILCALVLEILPYGVVLRFGNPEGDPFRETYSYFSLIPYGYANIVPLITAVLTCVLLLLLIISIILKKDLSKSAAIIAGTASALSLCPLPLFGADDFTAIGAAISICLITVTVVASFMGIQNRSSRKQASPPGSHICLRQMLNLSRRLNTAVFQGKPIDSLRGSEGWVPI